MADKCCAICGDDVDRFGNVDGKLGPWQREFVARVERIYKLKGVKDCTWNAVSGIQVKQSIPIIKNKETGSRYYQKTEGYRWIDSYFKSAMKVAMMGYVYPYDKCGIKGETFGFIPSYAPEATIDVLLNGPVRRKVIVENVLRQIDLEKRAKHENYMFKKRNRLKMRLQSIVRGIRVE